MLEVLKMEDSNQTTAVESITRRGEDIAKGQKEAGRFDKGTTGERHRPIGGSDARDKTGVDPQEPIDSDSTTK